MRNICTVDGCEEYVVGKGLCRKHYMRVQRTGSPDGANRTRKPCSVEGCEKPSAAHGLCDTHYRLHRLATEPEWRERRTKKAKAGRRAARPTVCLYCNKDIPVDTPLWWGTFCSERCRRLRKNEQMRVYRLMSTYGITVEQWDALKEHQHGVCAICGKAPDHGRWDAFAIDHDHTTGEVRGLLCMNCNNGIGRFMDDADLLHRAVAYLDSPPARAILAGSP